VHKFHQHRSTKFATYNLKIHNVNIFVTFNAKKVSYKLSVYISTLLKHNAAFFKVEISKGGKAVGSTEENMWGETKHLMDERGVWQTFGLGVMQWPVLKQEDIYILTSMQPTKK
jgi:hypothetical protein